MTRESTMLKRVTLFFIAGMPKHMTTSTTKRGNTIRAAGATENLCLDLKGMGSSKRQNVPPELSRKDNNFFVFDM
jgi:hypothetical protein